MSGVRCLGSVCRFVTDRLSPSEIMANTDPPRNSQSHHKISFFPSLSLRLYLRQTHSLSLSVLTLFALLRFLCVSHTHMRFLYLPFALSLSSLQLWPCAPSAPSFSSLLSVSSREARQRCQETDSARSAATIGHDGHLAISAKTEFTILTPRPNDCSQRSSIRSQPASETWTKPTRPPQRSHRSQDTFSDSTL